VPGAGPQPSTLQPYRGLIPADLCAGAVAGLGERAGPVRGLHERGLVPPDVLTGMTLLLLSSQPRRSRGEGEGGERKGAIEGGVWVREQVTYHAPVHKDSEVEVTGLSGRLYTRRGRRYGVNSSQTRDARGALLVSSCTTGLLSYHKEPSLPDGEQGAPASAFAAPSADAAHAATNPHRDRLLRVRQGDRVEAPPVRVTLELMRLRDAGRDENRIHTDPEVARREGLAAPIAGGSHVLSFLQAALMQAWGEECLLYGAHFDVQWVGQTRAGDEITPRATVTRATPQALYCDLLIEGADRALLRGTLDLPLGAEGA